LIDEHSRALSFLPGAAVRERIESRYALTASTESSGGPARYFRFADQDAAGSATRLGFISPHSHNFCHLCNRVRVTVEGRLLLCLGAGQSVDLRAVRRQRRGDVAALKQAIVAALPLKPEKHPLGLDGEPQILRFMNATGG